ncbi:hypothetical protein BABINDRAFT_160760 [Babjeviella inositovora NRRL Y-12698]|uniref:Up-regulated during septation protein 1 domain-containing protein n=1 Tax=Babjeviella inositovora NRRL Y-12698 TaxID=984486 RepID=A0A1E3QS22_9ASCO|nr:uncharacterized protein BABINDRAFT_160760 [Babjeviella inositovora NRRL Y-12698]ODQ80481.1 hypothetical protein BABINDRAFT_160760 [Babjeviella inositovora NRRL Y-12698]
MSNPVAPSGLFFITNSPFQVGCPDPVPVEDETLMCASLKQDYTENLVIEENTSMYSEVYEPLNRELLDGHLLDITERSLREAPDQLLSNKLRAELSVDDSHANVMELRLLIEHSLIQKTPTDGYRDLSQILSLGELDELKKRISKSKLACAKLEKRIAIVIELLTSPHSDVTQLTHLRATYDAIHKRIREVTTKIESDTLKLNNHHFSCLSLGYIDKLHIHNDSHGIIGPATKNYDVSDSFANKSYSLRTPGQGRSSVILDGLFAHIAGLAVQRGLPLPAPEDNDASSPGKVAWVQKCIDSIIATGAPAVPPTQFFDGASALQTSSRNNSYDTPSTDSADGPLPPSASTAASYYDDPTGFFPHHENTSFTSDVPVENPGKLIVELKTALKDLQFAHQYLVSSFETERKKFDVTVKEYKTKNEVMQQKLQQTNKALKVSTKKSIKTEIERSELETKFGGASEEVHDLRKQLYNLRLDSMGYNLSNGVKSSPSLPKSPVSNGFKSGSIDNLLSPSYGREPGTPLTTGVPFSPTVSAMSDLTSVGILRLEFKKMLAEMEEKYETQLEMERTERKKVERQLYEQQQRN